ncbi:MAG: hypothetical protein LBT78_10230 [Tannerella sp.]|nr:hypothetical protein [Tannerella sp.]
MKRLIEAAKPYRVIFSISPDVAGRKADPHNGGWRHTDFHAYRRRWATNADSH